MNLIQRVKFLIFKRLNNQYNLRSTISHPERMANTNNPSYEIPFEFKLDHESEYYMNITEQTYEYHNKIDQAHNLDKVKTIFK